MLHDATVGVIEAHRAPCVLKFQEIRVALQCKVLTMIKGFITLLYKSFVVNQCKATFKMQA